MNTTSDTNNPELTFYVSGGQDFHNCVVICVKNVFFSKFTRVIVVID